MKCQVSDLIRILRPIPDASHTRDRETSPPNSACFPSTRIEIIRRIVAWADSTLLRNTHVLWLYGFVGCGKSAIALAIALKFERRKRLVGSFFFFRNTGDRSRMTRFATTLACQLAAAIPEVAPFIKKAVKEEPGLLQSSLVAQLRRLVYEPFKAAAKRARLLKMFLLKGPFLIVIDGLDECEDRKDLVAFIDDMLEFFKKHPLVPLRFFITSRVEQHIQGHLKNDQVRLENLINHCSWDDINTFMQTCFEAEKKRNPVINAYIQKHGDWPTKKDRDQLVDHIGGSFIFASALFRYIVDPTDHQSTPMDRLPHTLNMSPGLDTLYLRTLSRSQDLPHFSNIISTFALLFEPLPIVGIAELLGIESYEVIRVLVNLQAIIHIPGTDDLPVTMCHTSLRDFLTTESRSRCFFAPPSFHIYLTNRCRDIKKEQRSGTAATLYIVGHFEKHLQMLDAAYAHILANSQDFPYFSDIISTIIFLWEPLSIVGIADLLGMEASDVSRVMTSLRALIDSPGINKGEPVIIRCTSLRDFLTSKTRSGTFFVSPSYHLKLSYHCFSFNFERQLNNIPSSPVTDYSEQRCRYHWVQFLKTNSEQSILNEPKQLFHLPSQNLSYHLFSFIHVFLWLFGDDSDHSPQQVWYGLSKCIESLALALECDPAPDRWLQKMFISLGFRPHFVAKHVCRSKIHQEHATALQRDVGRLGKAIREKCGSSLSESSSIPGTGRFTSGLWLPNWTPMKAYRDD
ncbi:hypothetical protein EST38_g12736 [Candolleomyces aberdarensis]|uniref:Nephrocystin 3-like N-terminal domain-containing protein n=1 Tax=Candolleomyces aberdarensis TaxID=2316362 RepID=A0A4Q2D1M8_9AGAR|nr:hypothetical protein EST38_g12736 [Candolleomyces aberdarensis]